MNAGEISYWEVGGCNFCPSIPSENCELYESSECVALVSNPGKSRGWMAGLRKIHVLTSSITYCSELVHVYAADFMFTVYVVSAVFCYGNGWMSSKYWIIQRLAQQCQWTLFRCSESPTCCCICLQMSLCFAVNVISLCYCWRWFLSSFFSQFTTVLFIAFLFVIYYSSFWPWSVDLDMQS